MRKCPFKKYSQRFILWRDSLAYLSILGSSFSFLSNPLLLLTLSRLYVNFLSSRLLFFPFFLSCSPFLSPSPFSPWASGRTWTHHWPRGSRAGSRSISGGGAARPAWTWRLWNGLQVAPNFRQLYCSRLLLRSPNKISATQFNLSSHHVLMC